MSAQKTIILSIPTTVTDRALYDFLISLKKAIEELQKAQASK